MSAFNISDSDDSQVVGKITDPVIADAISDFKGAIDSTGVVCRSSVLALEDLIGSNIITSNLSPNFFTEVPSTSGVEPLNKILSGVIVNIEDISGITIDSLYEKATKLISMANHLKHIAALLSGVSQDVVHQMINDKYTMTYDSNDKLCNVNDINILETLYWNSSYTSIILKQQYVDKIKDMISSNEHSGVGDIPLKLLSAIKGNNLDMYSIQRTQYDTITQGDILKLINSPEFSNSVDSLHKSLTSYVSEIKKSWLFYEDNIKELTKEVRRVNMLTDFLKDEMSVAILQTYADAEIN
jgi:hypothetical protein